MEAILIGMLTLVVFVIGYFAGRPSSRKIKDTESYLTDKTLTRARDQMMMHGHMSATRADAIIGGMLNDGLLFRERL